MPIILTVTLAVLAVLIPLRAEEDDLYNILAFQLLQQNHGQCSPYGGQCSNTVPCCQYANHGTLACFDGRCLQAQCGYPKQTCGSFIGECCWHLNLVCSSWLYGTCVPYTSAKK
ncbi:hypothetical protein Btru_043180 [Bulinus truncatus]|nr:hypothetical protein Btru_043180 [Bulinus truncatus]